MPLGGGELWDLPGSLSPSIAPQREALMVPCALCQLLGTRSHLPTREWSSPAGISHEDKVALDSFVGFRPVNGSA